MGSRNPSFEGPKKMVKKASKKKAVKKGPEKPFRLEVGKTYERRDGLKTRITAAIKDGKWAFEGVTDYSEEGEFSTSELSYTASGRFVGDAYDHDGDLIREAPTPKPKKAGKA